jgi:hypothetical protein
MVCGTHLFILSIDTQAVWSRLQWGEMVPNFLSTAWHGEAFHRLRVQDVENLILVDALFLLDGGRRREGKKKKLLCRRRVSPGLDPPCWLCSMSQLLGASKS